MKQAEQAQQAAVEMVARVMVSWHPVEIVVTRKADGTLWATHPDFGISAIKSHCPWLLVGGGR